MNKEALLELAARVERAEGADRGIDASVWLLAVEKPEPGDKIDGDMHGRWPAYTASLDAALGLVPEGWRNYQADFSVKNRTHWMLEGPKTKWSLDEGGERCAGSDWFVSGVAATPALALCAAALKALAAQENEL